MNPTPAHVGLPEPRGGWPAWVWAAPYRSEHHPLAPDLPSIEEGANCQRYAAAVLELFDRRVPRARSSELWDAPLPHPGKDEAQPLDLALFHSSPSAWGAHVVVVTRTGLLHLGAEEGVPALWSWEDFCARPRYEHLIGLIRLPFRG